MIDLARLAEIRSAIAVDVWPAGAVLECTRCGASQTATVEELAEYLHNGWPKCCGVTMRVEGRTEDKN